MNTSYHRVVRNLVVTSSESIKLNTLNFNIRIEGFTSNKCSSSRMRMFFIIYCV